jgi:3-hydroxyacyl-CoA dehydrogenase
LLAALNAAAADPAVQAVVLAGEGRGFSAGGDLSEARTGANTQAPTLGNDLQPRIERLGKPVVAALHGFAMGGGFETALACHYRVARPDTRLALPEVEHGLIPPSGTQRLPRAIGMAAALAMILAPQTRTANELNALADAAGLPPLFDAVVEGDAVERAIGFAQALSADERRPDALAARLLRSLAVPGRADHEALLAAAERAMDVDDPRRPARLACVAALRAACGDDFDRGLCEAWTRFVALQK